MKRLVFSFRFSILSIFVTLFIVSILSLMAVTYVRFSASMSDVSTRFMQQLSASVFTRINEEFRDAKLESDMSAELFRYGVLTPENASAIRDYTYSLMKVEAKTLPSVQAAFWGDESGNFIMSATQLDDTISTESILRKVGTNAIEHAGIKRNTQGKEIQNFYSKEITYDPRLRPWYIAAKKQKKTIITEVYRYGLLGPHYWGVTVATPIVDKNGQVKSVFALNLRIDYIRHLIEEIDVSQHGVIFIVSREGTVIAFPMLSQFTKPALKNIEELNLPWLTQSYEYYKSTGKREFTYTNSGKQYVAIYQTIHGFGQQEWFVGVVAPEEDFTSALKKQIT